MPEEKKESSLLKSWAYDEGTQILTVVFQDKQNKTTGVTTYGATYDYEGFPPDLWAEFSVAESKGKWFILNVRNGPYRFKRRQDVEETAEFDGT
jgi:hypothetical protein